MDPIFYKCPVCGNVMTLLVSSGITPICCGRPMKELDANTVEASAEAHVPSVECDKKCDAAHPCYEVSVSVGSTLHPSTIEHHISFIVLATESGGDVKILTPKMEPKATFCCSSKPLAVYAYCNLHQLWKAPVSCL